MEILVIAIAVTTLAIYGIWRVRRVGSVNDPDRAIQGSPDDPRNKIAFPDDPVMFGVPQQRPISRESGHGKDGGA
jgi:FtsZ-interacting cell division protein ZipA